LDFQYAQVEQALFDTAVDMIIPLLNGFTLKRFTQTESQCKRKAFKSNDLYLIIIYKRTTLSATLRYSNKSNPSFDPASLSGLGVDLEVNPSAGAGFENTGDWDKAL